jgi:hypothetical protein
METEVQAAPKTGCLGLAAGFFGGAVVGGVFEFILFSMEAVLKVLPLLWGGLALVAIIAVFVRKANDPAFTGFAKSALIGFLVSTLLLSGCYGILAFGHIDFR